MKPCDMKVGALYVFDFEPENYPAWQGAVCRLTQAQNSTNDTTVMVVKLVQADSKFCTEYGYEIGSRLNLMAMYLKPLPSTSPIYLFID